MPRNPASVVQISAAATPALLPQVLDNLLTLAGPEVAKDLLIQLLTDLETIMQALHTAAAPPDWPKVQAQSHNLIALAGTIGAARLHHLARLTNTLAHQTPPDLDAFHSLLPQMLEALDALVHVIRQKLHNCEDTA